MAIVPKKVIKLISPPPPLKIDPMSMCLIRGRSKTVSSCTHSQGISSYLLKCFDACIVHITYMPNTAT
jgi:hypothetical protein